MRNLIAINPHHDKVHHRNGVEVNGPPKHQPHHVHQNQRNNSNNNERRPRIHAEQNGRHAEYRCQRKKNLDDRRTNNVQVLLVEHVEYARKTDLNCNFFFHRTSKVLHKKSLKNS